ncbi:MAG: hypothetical protein IH991_21035, partial [Planctomycetes bacterium]|nr:hypothetical protein [Planctomycetota bacterium]
MARKVVNRKQLREEAEAAEKSEATKKKATKKKAATKKRKTRKKKKDPADIRIKLYWGVFSQSLKRVALYEYSQRKQAMKKAEEFIDESGYFEMRSPLEQGTMDLAMVKIEDEAREIYTEHLDRLAKLDDVRNFRYQLDMLTDESLTVDDVVDIFNRVNSAGTALTKADLAVAHVCSVWPQAREKFRDFTAEMGKHGFGVDLNFLVRSVAAVASGSVVLEGTFYKVPLEDLQLAWKKVTEAFEHLINVLRHEAFIDSKTDLATDYALMPPVVYLATNGGAFSDSQIKLEFIRWIYLASIWSRYTGQTETRLQRDVAIVLNSEKPVQALVEQILDERGRILVDAKDLEGKGSSSAAYKFSYVVARARGAKDWFTGQVLYNEAIGSSNGLESHHIFPLAYLKKLGYGGREHQRLRNEVANRAFLTQK